MKKLLNSLACILLTSPLAAFDIALDGVEFGILQMSSAQSTWPEGTDLLSEALTLNEGDVLQVLRWSTSGDNFNYNVVYSHGGQGSGNTYVDGRIYVTSGPVVTTSDLGFIVGPAVIQVGYKFEEYSHDYTYSSNAGTHAQLDYAILRKGTSTQSSYLTVPANASGNFEVKLQTSTDLQSWSPTTSGVFPYGANARFFRLVVE